MEVVLEDNGLKEFIDHDILKPPASDANDLDEWRKCVAKVLQGSLGTSLPMIRSVRIRLIKP